ncbi:MAG TPA: antitoxin Xre/MbcA/ParS toxin-binding domain-containing protein [Pirellulales bacterium]|nr:antitoxin Xre/MbcA/ParS toxin-binding domain-containing protein [Pirellulales bacterium]
MRKKSTARPNARKKAATRRKPVAKRRYRPAATVSSGQVPLVESESGRALRLRAQLGMSRQRFARLASMSTRNLAFIESGKPPSANVLRQLHGIRRLIDALSEVVQKDAIGRWLEQPNDAFEGQKPIDVIERGEVDRIWQRIFYLRSGVPS